MSIILFEKEILKFDEVVFALLMNKILQSINRFSNDGQVAMVANEFRQGRGWLREEDASQH